MSSISTLENACNGRPCVFPSSEALVLCGPVQSENQFPCMSIDSTGLSKLFNGLNIDFGNFTLNSGDVHIQQGSLLVGSRFSIKEEGVTLLGKTLTLDGGVLNLKDTQIKVDGNPLGSPEQLLEAPTPRFSVYKTSALPLQEIGADGSPVLFDGIRFNVGNFFQPNTSTIIAPESGYYKLSCGVTVTAHPNTGQMKVTVNSPGHKRSAFLSFQHNTVGTEYSLKVDLQTFMEKGTNASCNFQTIRAFPETLSIAGDDDDSMTYFEGEKVT